MLNTSSIPRPALLFSSLLSLPFPTRQAGDVARSTGKAGLAVVEKSKEINTQYGVTDKVRLMQSTMLHGSTTMIHSSSGILQSFYC